MRTLHLVLKKEWFELIASGRKKEEYRETTQYWRTRIDLGPGWYDTITFSCGYAKNRRQMVVKCLNIYVGAGYVDWGASPEKTYYVIELGKIISTSWEK